VCSSMVNDWSGAALLDATLGVDEAGVEVTLLYRRFRTLTCSTRLS
jgi:hypothetical protein